MRAKRKAAQPSGIKTFGSTFRNPDEDPRAEGRTAGQLLDAAGCRGLRVGGAGFSEKHANFVENHGRATHRRRAGADGRGPPPRARALRDRARAGGADARPGRAGRRSWELAAMSATRAGSLPQRLARVLRRPSGAGLAARPALRRPRPRTLARRRRGARAAARRLVLAARLLARRRARPSRSAACPGRRARAIRSALEEAARSMTTLHVRQGALDSAAAPFSLVKRDRGLDRLPAHDADPRRDERRGRRARRRRAADRRHVRRHAAARRDRGAGACRRSRCAARRPARASPSRTPPPRSPRSPPRRRRCARACSRSRRPPTTASRSSSRTGRVLWFGDGRAAGRQVGGGRGGAGRPAGGGRQLDRRLRAGAPAVGGVSDGAPATGESDVPTLPDTATTPAAACGDGDHARFADARRAAASPTG